MKGTPARRAVFLDRDGVLNEAVVRDGVPRPPSPEDLRIPGGVPEACELLRSLGFVLAVVTTQPDVARGTLDRDAVDRINTRLRDLLGLDSVWVCPHDDADGCDCRKPAPGLILRAARHHGIDLASSYMVGDRWRDVEAGRAAGCRTVFIQDPRYKETVPVTPDHVAGDLREAAGWIARRQEVRVGD